ncbi:MAG: NAD(P)/FAD-dependent oxidoreductase [Pseudomonadota bacterium]
MDASSKIDLADILIVGGGVVGAATAQTLASRGLSILLVEAGPRFAEGVTSRNSGVVHGGLYYKPGSLKAKLCIKGNELLYAWCARHGVPFRKTGKLVLAKNAAEREELEALLANARASGAEKCRLVTSGELRELEPELEGVAALWSPETGIVDPAALTESLISSAVDQGAAALTNCRVTGLDVGKDGIVVHSSRGEVSASMVVNAAGLYADDVARMAGVERYKIHPCRGDYFTLKTAIQYEHLIYPVKGKKDVGLGVHLTMDLAGKYRLGPDAEYVTSKEDFSPAEHKLERFLEATGRLLGPVSRSQMSYDTCGIRPKLRSPSDAEEKDFVISKDLPGLINLVGIDSPGLTAALAIGEYVREKFFGSTKSPRSE